MRGVAHKRLWTVLWLLAVSGFNPLESGFIRGTLAESISETNAPTGSPLDKIENIIVIYLENWSFDGLFGKFPGANNALQKMTQTDKNGTVYTFLPPDKFGVMTGPGTNGPFPNKVWDMKPLMDARDENHPLRWLSITHRYYHEIYQINGGKMDRFAAWSSADGITMSYYDITNEYFGQLARNYTLCDNFFHSAFGGSFLNHQWLIAARTPVYYPEAILPEWRDDLIATFDENGFIVNDGPVSPDYYAVNHIESRNPPLNPRTDPSHRMPSQNHTTVGDLLSDAGIDWRWYSGGYNDAMEGNAPNFQYHHQPFVFFDRFKDPNSADRRSHLRDEVDLLRDLAEGNLPRVSFYKPYGEDNFHPGSSTVSEGQTKLKEIVDAIQQSRYWSKCAIVITFDENGGRWDHVTPPKGDIWGPGSRIPAVIVSPFVRKGFVDHGLYETISITKWIEEFGRVNGTVIPSTRSVNSLAKLFLEHADHLGEAPSGGEDLVPVSDKESNGDKGRSQTALIALAVVVGVMLLVVIGLVVLFLVRYRIVENKAITEPLAGSGPGTSSSAARATRYDRLDDEIDA